MPSPTTNWPDARIDALDRQVQALIPLSVSIATLSGNVAALTQTIETMNKATAEDIDRLEKRLDDELEDLRPSGKERRDRRMAFVVVACGAITGLLTSLVTGLIPH